MAKSLLTHCLAVHGETLDTAALKRLAKTYDGLDSHEAMVQATKYKFNKLAKEHNDVIQIVHDAARREGYDVKEPESVAKTPKAVESKTEEKKAAAEVKPSEPTVKALKAESEKSTTRTAPATPGKGMEVSHVQSVVDMIRKAWSSLPEVHVVSLKDMSPAEREVNQNRRGVYDTVNGKPQIGLIAENLHNPAHVVATLYHEGLGHFGLARAFKDKLDSVLNAIYKSHGETRAEADKWLEEHPDTYTGADKLARGVEEVLANRSEQGTVRPALWSRIVSAVREFGRKMGVDVAYNDHDITSILRQAHEAAKTEGDVLESGTRTAHAYTKEQEEGRNMFSPTSRGGVSQVKDHVTSDKLSKFMLDVRATAIDHHAHTLALMDEAVKHGAMTQAEAVQLWTNMNLVDSMPSLVQWSINRGIAKLKDVDGGKVWMNEESANLVGLAKVLAEGGHDMNQYAAYERALHETAVGFKSFMDPKAKQLAAEVIRQGNDIPEFIEAHKMTVQMNKDIIKMLIDSGRISKEEGARWKPETYTPSYSTRANGDIFLDGGAGKPVRIGNTKDMPELYQLKGGEKELLPFMAGKARNIEVMTHAAIQNYSNKSIAYMLRDLGEGKLTKNPKAGADTIQFYEGGEARTFKINREAGIATLERFTKTGTPEQRARAQKALDMMSDTNYISIPNLVANMGGVLTVRPGLLKLATWPARVLHTAITRNPLYPIKQLPRDVGNAFILNGGNTGELLSIGRRLKDAFRGADANANFLAYTGAGESNILKGHSDDIGRQLSKMYGAGGGTKGMLNQMRYLADRWATAGDMANRSMLYESGKKNGMTDLEARKYAIEAGTNFKAHGSSQSLYIANMITPFLNSQIRGIDVAVRALRGMADGQEKTQAFQKLVVRGSMLALSSLAYHTLVSDEDWYKNLSPEVRANNYCIHLPGMTEPLLIPISFETGTLFKAIPEALATWYKDSNGLGFQDMKHMLKSQIISNIPGGAFSPDNADWFIPTLGLPGAALKPVIGWAGNFDFQTGRPIETPQMQKLDPAERYNDKTSEFAKQAGASLNLSPVQIDQFIKGYVSTMGTAVAHYAAAAVTTPREGVSPATPLLSQNQFLRGFFAPIDGHAVLNAEWDDVISKPQIAKNTFDRIAKVEMNPEKATAYMQAHPEMAYAKTAATLQKQIGKTSTLIKQIPNMPDSAMSPEAKRKMITELNASINQYGGIMAQLKKQMYPATP